MSKPRANPGSEAHASATLPRYCLHCFSHDVEEVEGSLECAHCRGLSRRADRREFWNLHPGIRRVESAFKGLLLSALAVFFGWILAMTFAPETFDRAGCFFLVPVAAYWAMLWKTVSLLTRRDHGIGSVIIWRVALGAWVPLLVLVAVMIPSGTERVVTAVVLGGVFAILVFGPALFRRLRAGRIRRGADPALRDRFRGLALTPSAPRDGGFSASCLTCYGEKPARSGRRWTCPRCGTSNSTAEGDFLWTSHPRIVRLQEGLGSFFVVYPLLVIIVASVLATADSDRWVYVVMAGGGLALLGIGPLVLIRDLRRRHRSWLAAVGATVTAMFAAGWNWRFATQEHQEAFYVAMPWLVVLGAAFFLWIADREAWMRRLRDEAERSTPAEIARLAAPSRRRARLRPRYCLHCFSHRIVEEEGTFACEACGGRSRPSDRRRYWNLHPKFAELEFTLKVGIVFVGVCLLGYVLMEAHARERNQGWFLAFGPTAFVVASWGSASKLRQHLYAFRASLFWALVVFVCGLALLPVFATHGASGVQVVVAAAVTGALALGTLGAGRVFDRVRDRWIEGGAEG